MFFLLILIALEIIYCAFKFSMILVSLFGNFDLIFNPIVILGLLVYGICIYIGRGFFRYKKYGWYGIVVLNMILILKEIFLAILVILLGQSLSPSIHIPNVWPGILELLIYGIIIRYAFSSNTLRRFEFKTDSIVFSKVLGVSFVATILYLLFLFAAT